MCTKQSRIWYEPSSSCKISHGRIWKNRREALKLHLRWYDIIYRWHTTAHTHTNQWIGVQKTKRSVAHFKEATKAPLGVEVAPKALAPGRVLVINCQPNRGVWWLINDCQRDLRISCWKLEKFILDALSMVIEDPALSRYPSSVSHIDS